MLGMKLLYLSLAPQMGINDPLGYGTHMREVASALENAGHEVIRYIAGSGGVVAREAAGVDPGRRPGAGGGGATRKRRGGPIGAALPRPVRHLARDVSELVGDARVYGRLERLVSEAGVDAIYERSAFMQLSGVRLAAARGLPHVLEVNAPIEERRDHHGYPLFRIGVRREQEKMRLADQMVCVTSPLKSYLAERGADPARISVIPNAVRPEVFAVEPEARAELRRRLGVAPDQVAVGYIGRFAFWRGMPALMAACAQVAAATRRAHVVLVGDGQLMPDVKRFIAEHDLDSRVTLTGGVAPDAVPAHVAALDIGLLAGSPWYSSPIKLFEYGAAGLAIVAPRVTAVEEVMADGHEGILVRDEDASALAAAVLALVADDARRRELGARYRERVLREYTWDRVAAQVTALLAGSARRKAGVVPREER